MNLGPFKLEQEIGRGGMGVIWKGVHQQQNIPVAIKIMTAQRALSEKFVESFENEARATASVQHPAIVAVFDYGTLDKEAVSISPWTLSEGSPYLVMELASEGSLESMSLPVEWSLLKYILLTLLDALAHAHARGLVHRDLKPANVIVCGESDLRPGLKLTDFGIVHAMNDETRSGTHEDKIIGTPKYMAPEQFTGLWRDYGPWTDLYSLGCIAYELAVGHPPFQGDSFKDYYILHHRSPFPSLGNQVNKLPSGFHQWLQRMCAKDPAQRFRFAADAAWELKNLQEPGTVAPMLKQSAPLLDFSQFSVDHGTDTDKTEISNEFPTMEWTDSQDGLEPQLALEAPGLALSARHVANKRPPFPPSWRSESEQVLWPALHGVGLGLYGLRPVPLAGRVHERDVIWRALQQVHHQHCSEAILLQGTAGTGKSRIAEWISERSHELGAAQTIKASHSPIPSHGDALQQLVGKYLNCLGLKRKDIRTRVEQHLATHGIDDPYELGALTSFLPAVDETSEEVTFEQEVKLTSQAQIWALVARFLVRISRDRPVVVWLDDVYWDSNSVGFVRYVLENRDSHAINALFLVTVRDDLLAERPYQEEQIEELSVLSGCQRLQIGMLSERESRELVRSIIGLDDELAQLLEKRAAGNPLFAVQLLGDWVEREILEVGQKGFQLKDGASVYLPDEVYEVWSERLERLLSRCEAEDEAALMVAAALGNDVDMLEWSTACMLASRQLSEKFVRELRRYRFIAGDVSRWSWAHAMLRETVVRRAKESGQWAMLNTTCVNTLSKLYPPDARHLAERKGLYLLEANEADLAYQYLLQGAKEAAERSDYGHALYVLSRCRNALKAPGVPESDERWGLVAVAQAEYSNTFRSQSEAMQAATALKEVALKHGWETVYPDVLACMAKVSQRDHDQVRQTEDLYDQAKQAYERIQHHGGMANSLRGLGWCATMRAQHDQAQKLFHEALEIYEDLQDAWRVADCLRGLAMIARKKNSMPTARQWLIKAQKLYHELGGREGAMWCIHDLAEIDRETGDLEAAEEGYTKTIQLMESLGINDDVFPRFNLGLVQVARKNYSAARHTFRKLLKEFKKQERPVYQGIAHICLLPCVAAHKDWKAFDRHLSYGQKFLANGIYVDPDLAENAELAGALSHEHGDNARAVAAYQFAVQHWSLLKNIERAQRAQHYVDSLVVSVSQGEETTPEG